MIRFAVQKKPMIRFKAKVYVYFCLGFSLKVILLLTHAVAFHPNDEYRFLKRGRNHFPYLQREVTIWLFKTP